MRTAEAHSAGRRATPARPHRAHPSPHRPNQPQRTAIPQQHQNKAGLLGALSNLAGQSGGTPPAGQQQQAGQPSPWESDPILQQIQALQQSNTAAAEAQAAAARSQALINFGYDPGMATLYGDQQTAGSAKANPYSVLSQLQHSHELQQKGINEARNQQNLFYSSTRANDLGEEGRTYLGNQAAARAKLSEALSGISGGVLTAKQNAQGAILQGRQDAYTRWLNQQLQYGLGGTAPAATRKAVPAKHKAKPRNVARTAIPATLRRQPA